MVYRAIENKDRRQIISTLIVDGEVKTKELIEKISNGPNDYENAEIRLYHCHLPMLKDAGVINYDWRSDDIVFKGDEQKLRVILGTLEEEDHDLSPSP